MSWAIIGLSAGFIFVIALLLLLLLKSRLALPLKTGAVIIATLFYWLQYSSLQQFAGWPVSGELPEEFVLIAAEVIEPNKSTGEPGVMYWWIRESGDLERPPRVYQLPYVNQVHQQAAEVLNEQKKGGQFIGRQSGDRHSDGKLGISFDRLSKSSLHQKRKSIPQPVQ